MRITKYTHACVRLDSDGRVLVIDPGIWSEPRALVGADAVLVTHEHTDHVDVLRLGGLGVPVFVPAEARLPDPPPGRTLDVTRVEVGQEFSAAGFQIRAVGGRHATVYDGQPDCVNLGYIVDDLLYHPGDSLHVPNQAVDTLLVPAQASWLKTSEAVDFVQAVRPGRSLLIHDAQINERGLASINGWLTECAGPGHRYLSPGDSVD